MATWSRRERTIHLTEYVVPADEPFGACWNQVQQALNAAMREVGYDPEASADLAEPTDDAIRIHPGENEIIIRIEHGA